MALTRDVPFSQYGNDGLVQVAAGDPNRIDPQLGTGCTFLEAGSERHVYGIDRHSLAK